MNSRGVILQFALSVAVFGFLQAANPDEITSLPGLTSKINFRHYSGYLNATGTKKLHYWFVESQNDPGKDPLLLWLNGGPGCSSLDGFLSELGPFHVNNDGKTLYMNDYSWNKVANILFLEAPAGVGFSYSDDKNYTTSDDETSLNNYAALQSFFTKFPEFLKHPFYITGESYGGIYVPTLAMRVMQANSSINLKGFAVGNGLSSWELNDNSVVYFAYYHGVIGHDTWSALNEHCCNQGVCNFHNNTNEMCVVQLNKVHHLVWSSGLNRYSLYSDCEGGIPPHATRFLADLKNLFKFYKFKIPKFPNKKKNGTTVESFSTHGLHLLNDNIPCVNTTAETMYMNQDSVRKALHVVNSDIVPTWQVCSDEVGDNYKSNYESMDTQYKALLAKYRGLVYNGDTDMACNFLGDEWFVDGLKLKETQARQQWIYNKQVAGFYHKYENLTYATVKGAGHMVPQWKPAQALEMITNFLSGVF